MKLKSTPTFDKNYQSLPMMIQKRTDEKLQLLLSNPQHPSLQIKKMKGVGEIWEGRVTTSYRFTFQIEGDTYILRKVGTHEILKKP